jgi:hypothetical protein
MRDTIVSYSTLPKGAIMLVVAWQAGQVQEEPYFPRASIILSTSSSYSKHSAEGREISPNDQSLSFDLSYRFDKALKIRGLERSEIQILQLDTVTGAGLSMFSGFKLSVIFSGHI